MLARCGRMHHRCRVLAIVQHDFAYSEEGDSEVAHTHIELDILAIMQFRIEKTDLVEDGTTAEQRA